MVTGHQRCTDSDRDSGFIREPHQLRHGLAAEDSDLMFDFPNNPAAGTPVTLPDGAVRTWDGQKWKAGRGVVSLSAVISDTPPVAPFPGQFWFDSANPQLYLWYSDPNSSQWVIATANAGGLSADAPVDGNLYGRSNAAWSAINQASLGGPFLPLVGGTTGPLQIGNGTGTPTLTLNGAAGTAKGVYWQTASTMRWRLQTDASDNLALYAYGAGGAFIDTGILFNQSNKTATFNFQLNTANTTAPVAGGVAGTSLNAANNGANAAYGHRLGYNSSSGGSGFDTGLGVISIFDPIFIAGQSPALEALWIVAQSPNDTTHNWGCNIGELNIVNRGRDAGFTRDRSTSLNPTGGLLMVAESQTFGGTGGGEGKNATYAYSVARSANNNSTGFPAKFYACFLAEPNSIAGLTGRALYATGDITGVSSQYPYGPLQTDGTWLHGIDHTLAVYGDTHAEKLAITQKIGWIVGTTAAPTAIATIGAFGSGAAANLQLLPASGSSVQIGDGTGIQSLNINGAAGVNTGVNWYTAGNPRWRMVLDASNNLNLYGYNASGGFIGAALRFDTGASLIVEAQAPLIASAGFGVFAAAQVTTRPTVTGAKGSNAALASLLSALAAYGLITDSTSA
jgi:hypothetical protein